MKTHEVLELLFSRLFIPHTKASRLLQDMLREEELEEKEGLLATEKAGEAASSLVVRGLSSSSLALPC